MNIDAIHSADLAFERPELDLNELPPIPQEFLDELAELGGYCNGYPNVRIVSGLDPEHMEFYGGKWWRKYAFREHSVKEYYTYTDKKTQKRKILTVAEGEVYRKSKKLMDGGILVPVIERNVYERGIPRYFVELYKPPIAFGSLEEWESLRYLQPDDPMNLTGEFLDLLGDFPENGMYETWFCIEEPVEENGIVVSTQFKAIDDVAKEFIRFMVTRIKEESASETHAKMVEANLERVRGNLKSAKEEIRDRVKDRIDKIVQTPKTFGTGKEVPATTE